MIETTMEGLMVVRKEGKVVALAHNDLDRRSVVFYEVKEMGLENYQELLSG